MGESSRQLGGPHVVCHGNKDAPLQSCLPDACCASRP